MVVTAHNMLQELQTFTDIDEDAFVEANNSNINTKNNQDFKKLVNDWNDGMYDNDPDMLVNEIYDLISNQNTK